MNIGSFYGNKDRYTLEDLLKVMETLRSPQGCSWDREQTSKSLRRDFLEECYEALEAIDAGNPAMLREELGDVLLHVVFQSRIAEEAGQFTFADVASDVAAKMVLRHPHVFAGLKVNGTEDILNNWDAIKKESKGQSSQKEVLESVSPAMPALMRHQKVLKKAAKNGIPVSESPLAEIRSMTEKPSLTEAEIGKLLSLAVSVAQQAGVDAEQALGENTKKFIGSVKS